MKLFIHKRAADAPSRFTNSRIRTADQPITVQFGDELVEVTDDARDSVLHARLSAGIDSTEEIASNCDPSWVHLVSQKGRLFNVEHPEVPVLYDRGRFQLVAIDPERAKTLSDEDICFNIRPLRSGDIVFEQAAKADVRLEIPDWERGLVAAVDASELAATLESLTAFANRHSLSDDYLTVLTSLEQSFKEMGYATSVEPIDIFSRRTGDLAGQSANLIASKAGTASDPKGSVYVTAHLDSVNLNNQLDPTLAAPGADDNGSGSAGVMEIARVFARHACEQDLHFVLFGGEEQNLFGSSQFVEDMTLKARERVLAVVNMDMIGVENARPATVLLEGAPISGQVIDGLSLRASAHTDLSVRTSENPFASDHVPFIRRNMPAVLTIEGDDSQNTRIHTPDDVPEHIDREYAADILRMNVGYIASLVGRST